jgi:pimeloyl-ACP methyl ester carboxylesterase
MKHGVVLRADLMRIESLIWPIVLLLLVSANIGEAASADASSLRMVTRDGHRIAFHVTPGHLPVIVLDAGGGLDSSYWDTLVPQLAKRTGSEIITYDRAGFGDSDEAEGPWSVQSATADLASGLYALGATHDVILVAHSVAGEIATYLANEHPSWIAGAVLVDANVPDFFTDREIARQIAQYKPAIAAAKAAPSTKADRQLLALAASYAPTSHAFHRMTWPRSIPAVVIVSEKTPFETIADAQAWRVAHLQFVAHAQNRQLIVSDKSSHDVAHDRPDVIIEATAGVITHSVGPSDRRTMGVHR